MWTKNKPDNYQPKEKLFHSSGPSIGRQLMKRYAMVEKANRFKHLADTGYHAVS